MGQMVKGNYTLSIDTALWYQLIGTRDVLNSWTPVIICSREPPHPTQTLQGLEASDKGHTIGTAIVVLISEAWGNQVSFILFSEVLYLEALLYNPSCMFLYVYWCGYTFYMQAEDKGVSPAMVGFIIGCSPLCIVIVSPLIGFLVRSKKYIRTAMY